MFQLSLSAIPVTEIIPMGKSMDIILTDTGNVFGQQDAAVSTQEELDHVLSAYSDHIRNMGVPAEITVHWTDRPSFHDRLRPEFSFVNLHKAKLA